MDGRQAGRHLDIFLLLFLHQYLYTVDCNEPLPCSQGLYHSDQRFGPGVISCPDGCEDVGLWVGERLLKLCASVEESFSLKNLPEYAAYMDPATTSYSLTQVHANYCLTHRWIGMQARHIYLILNIYFGENDSFLCF